MNNNADTAPPLHAADETGSEHGASASRRVCRRTRVKCQEPFVCVASPMEAVPDGVSEFFRAEDSAGWALVRGAVSCSIGWNVDSSSTPSANT